MAYKGLFKPKNSQKYRGDVKNIIYRSRWELKLLMRFDSDPNILQYSSEEFCIPYISPIDQKWHRYFPDMWVKTSDGRNLVIEVKPFKQTIMPIKPKKNTAKYINEVKTYAINKHKWNAAEKYCQKRGENWHFLILTEKELDINF